MAIQDSIHHVKGYLYMQPTGVSASSVYGTQVAYTEDGYVVSPNIQTYDDVVAEYGEEVVNTRDIGDSPVITFVAKTYNYEIAHMMAGSRAGTVGTDAVVYQDYPGTVVPGSDLPAYRYLFVPEDTTIPLAFVAHRGQAITPPDTEIKMMLAEETKFPIFLRATRSSAGTASAVYNYRKLRISRVDKLAIDTSLP